ncbi:p21-carboxy-terminal region-binding protein [Medicago truncatula]|uniref:P21-carboxy-terminal region-binding protein n=1 Tax=Medicago truncatula TaxID=3880 RepID=G7J512_MEDTR|nr:p21-carboxy-terminal region-binding protein [Medicago truncatula]
MWEQQFSKFDGGAAKNPHSQSRRHETVVRPPHRSVFEMPRKPRRKQRPKSWPVTFSPFARALARMASVSKPNRRSKSIESSEKPTRSSTSNGSSKHTLEERPEGSESSDGEFDGVVQADFAFFDPKPNDFHGVKTLLQTYLDVEEWDLSGFADLILEQTTVGTVVKVEDDEDEGVFALATALNLWRYREQRCIMKLKEFLLLKASQEKGVGDQLRLLLGERAHNVGLLVSQRVVNLPPQLLPHLYDSLFNEVSWATEDEPTEDLRNSFQFKHYIILSKIYKHKNAEQQKRKRSDDREEEIVYVKPEDEIFHELSSWSFCFPLRTQQPAPHELKNYRSMGLIMTVEADKIPTFRQQLTSLINEGV